MLFRSETAKAAAAAAQLPPKNPAIPAQTPEKAGETRNFISVMGHEVVVPSPKEVIQASTTAVIGTTATLATAMIFNQARKVVGETIAKAARSKFKIKLKAVKPVLHFIREDDGVTVIEYSAEGMKTVASGLQSPEQFMRDMVESDEFFEVTNKIVIDETVKEMFSKEGAKRFNYFQPPKRLAKRLSAR